MRFKPVAKAAAKISRNQPAIMTWSGIIIVLAAFGLTVKAGMEVKEVMEISAEKVEELEKKEAEQLNVEDLTEEQKQAIVRACNKDISKARAEGVWKVTKLFILPGIGLVVGLTLIGGGFKILKKRNVVLGMAAEGYKKTLDFYRKNVVAAEGEEADLRYMRGVTGEQEITDIQKDADGKEKKTSRKVPVVKGNDGHKNPWRFMFDETYFLTFEPDTDRNLFFLQTAQDWWNHEYNRRGEEGISMYEILVYLRYNFDVDKDGMTKEQYRDWITFLRNYGWRKGNGDDMIDFGLFRAINEPARRRQSEMVWLEFNCSGNLQDLTVKK